MEGWRGREMKGDVEEGGGEVKEGGRRRKRRGKKGGREGPDLLIKKSLIDWKSIEPKPSSNGFNLNAVQHTIHITHTGRESIFNLRRADSVFPAFALVLPPAQTCPSPVAFSSMRSVLALLLRPNPAHSPVPGDCAHFQQGTRSSEPHNSSTVSLIFYTAKYK